MRSSILFWVTLALVGCTKTESTGRSSTDAFGEPIGIELPASNLGAHLIVAVAAEKGHEIPAGAVPELASALAGVQKGCTISAVAQVTATVKDGALAAPVDPKMDAASTCVAKAIDGKSVKSLTPGKILFQIAPGKAEQ